MMAAMSGFNVISLIEFVDIVNIISKFLF